MTAQKPSLHYENVDFHFLGPEEDSYLQGTVHLRHKEMVLDIPGGDGPYMIVGKPRESWFEGSNIVRDRDYDTEARWAFVGGTYVGLWIEDGYEYLFSFCLGSEEAE